MQIQAIETEQLLLEVASLREELFTLKQDKDDLELLLETTLTHAETIEIQLQESNQQLQAEIVERQRAESVLKALTEQLQYFLNIVNRDKKDLEIILETTTEHGDLIGNFLQDKAEEARRNSERKLAQFLEAVPVGVRILDANGKHYYSNRQAKIILNKKCDFSEAEDSSNLCQIYVAGTDELYPPDQLPSKRALKGETSTVDDLEIRADGKVICLEAWGTPIFDENGKITHAIIAFQDISQRKKAETERQKSITSTLR